MSNLKEKFRNEFRIANTYPWQENADYFWDWVNESYTPDTKVQEEILNGYKLGLENGYYWGSDKTNSEMQTDKIFQGLLSSAKGYIKILVQEKVENEDPCEHEWVFNRDSRTDSLYKRCRKCGREEI